jgi:hypothetical protein
MYQVGSLDCLSFGQFGSSSLAVVAIPEYPILFSPTKQNGEH